MANQFQATGMSCFIISLLIGRTIFMYGTLQLPWVFLEILAGIVILLLWAVGAIYLFIASQAVSKHATIHSALLHFCLVHLPLLLSRKRLAAIRSCCTTPMEAQEKCLRAIVTCNKRTEYGNKFNLKDITCLKDLQAKHPLTDYKDYEQYVQRIANGEMNVITAAKVTRLCITSGTTGSSKLIPMDMDHYYSNIMATTPIHYGVLSGVQPLQKVFRLHCNARIRKSKCGLTIAALMVVEKDLSRYMVAFSTPPDGLLIENKETAFYVHFLFGLRERNVGMATALYASLLVDGFNYLEMHWPRIVEDLAHGTLNPDLNLPASIRESLTRALGSGDPGRAEEVRRECEKGPQGIMRRLWPMMRGVFVIDTTGIRDHIMKTIGEGLVVWSPLYASSEHILGINIDPYQQGQEEYLLMIADVIYEFIPEEDIDKTNARTHLIDEVELGENYELVITQMWGLYRYRMGDVVKISGYYKNCPKVKFMYRTGALLNLFGEKVNQVTIRESLNSALSRWIDVDSLRHYWVAESTLLSGLLPINEDFRGSFSHYVFFLEIGISDKNSNDSSIKLDLPKLAQQIDENICCRDTAYGAFRENGKIAPSVVYLVKTGTADELKAHILANTSATEIQFKMPEKIRTREMAEIMTGNIHEGTMNSYSILYKGA